MLKLKYLLPFLIIAVLFVGFIIGSPFIVNKIFADTALSGPLTGYAWSSNIGWIKFHSDSSDPVSFGVQLRPDGKLAGQAWSSNIGWVNFDNLGTGPDGQGSASLFGASSIKGWARACSVFASGCTGTLKLPEYRGGWDGWLQMGPQTSTNGWSGVSIMPGGQLAGYAWGSEILGWVKFDGVTSGTCTGVCVSEQFEAACSVNKSIVAVDEPVTFTVNTLNGNGPYIYNWSITPATGSGNDDAEINSPNPSYNLTRSFSRAGDYTFRVDVTSDQVEAEFASCNVGLQVTNDQVLTVNVVGSGSVTSNPAGISSCTNSCQAGFTTDTTVTLTANPQAEATFQSWVGCDAPAVDPDTGVNTCRMTMDEDKTVTARFEEVQKFNISISYPNGNSMLVNSRSPLPAGTPTIDGAHISSKAIVTLTRFDQDVPLPNIINLSLRLDSLRGRIPEGVDSVVGMGGPILVGPGGSTQRQYEIYLTFTNDAQPRANTASPYAGGYRLTLTAAPVDGSKTLTAPVNFSYIDSREQEQ